MISKLNKEKNAWRYIIPELNSLWDLWDSYVSQLRNNGLQVTTEDVISKRKALADKNSNFNQFKNAFSSWFATEYPDYSVALDGAISSIDNIVASIDQLGENYKDLETGKYIMSDVAQSDRDVLANQIDLELE